MRLNNKLVWRALLLVRFILVLVPQSGYIHPDEFFQGPEIVAGDVFNFTIHYAWEFNTSSPIRSVVSTHPAPGLAFTLLRSVRDVDLGFAVTSYLLLVTPRLVMTLMSLLHDWSLYRLCVSKNKDPYIPLTLFGSSYVCLVYYTRTLSNSLESILFSVLLSIVGCDLAPESKQRTNKKTAMTVGDFSSSCTIIGIVVTCGFFIRPTFALFAFCPLLFWFVSKIRSERNRVWKSLDLANKLVLSVLPIAFVLITLDTLYYRGFRSFGDVLNHDVSDILENAVVTPLNFVKYNIQASNLRDHGLHPRFLHLVINFPLLYGVLGVFGIFFCSRMILQCIVKQQWISYGYLNVMITASWCFPVTMLSIVPHQEPRFLIPSLLPLAFLHAKFIFKHTPLVACWFATNILMVAFFGFAHQGGVIPCLTYLSKSIVHSPAIDPNTRINLVFYRTYMPPLHLLHIGKDEKTVVHDLRGQEMYALILTLNNMTPNKSRNIYLVAPASVEKSMKSATEDKFELQPLKSFFPHFSVEDLPKSLMDLTTIDKLQSQFSLRLYQVHPRKHIL